MELDMTGWIALLTALGVGGILTKAADAVIKGLSDARLAKRQPLNDVEALRLSRLTWMEVAAEARRLVVEIGQGDRLEALPPDPYPPKPEGPHLRKEQLE